MDVQQLTIFVSPVANDRPFYDGIIYFNLMMGLAVVLRGQPESKGFVTFHIMSIAFNDPLADQPFAERYDLRPCR